MQKNAQRSGNGLGGKSKPVGAGESRKARAYRYIQSKIISGELSAGQPVSEPSLSREIGISRTPVREAIGQLTAEGFLEQIPGRGTVVKLPTRSGIQELYELREALEVYSAGKAARQPLQPDDAENLDNLCDAVISLADSLRTSGQRSLDAAAMERFLALDMRFHLLLLRAAGNQRILKVVRDTRLMIRIFHIQREGHDAPLLQEIYGYHKGILDAVRGGDAERAMQLAGEHIRASCRERLNDYDRWERMSQIRLDSELLSDFGA